LSSIGLRYFVSYKAYKHSKLKLWNLGFRFLLDSPYINLFKVFFKRFIIFKNKRSFRNRLLYYRLPRISKKYRKTKYINKTTKIKKLKFSLKNINNNDKFRYNKMAFITSTRIKKIKRKLLFNKNIKKRKRKIKKFLWKRFLLKYK